MICKTEILNAPEETDRYIVARLVGGRLWYWGCWEDKEKAENVVAVMNNTILFDKEL